MGLTPNIAVGRNLEDFHNTFKFCESSNYLWFLWGQITSELILIVLVGLFFSFL